ncbi:metal-dependent hydrolase [Kaarinaea lacus]
MDTVTHGLLGALTIRSLPKRYEKISLRELTVLGFVAAMFPDVDYLTFWIHPLQFLAEWHRAATHSFIMMPLWSMLLGFLASIAVKARWKWPVYSLVCGIAISTHIFSDMITIYGTQILNPMSDYRAVIGTTFFIDGYFTGIVLTGVIVSIILKRKQSRYHRQFAALTIAVLLSYIGLQSYFRSLANNFAQRYVAQNQLHDISVYNLPQPFSPTYWKVIIEDTDKFRVSYINVAPTDWHQAFTRFMVKMLTGNNEILIEAMDNYVAMETAVWQSYQKINNSNPEVAIAWNQDEFSAFRKFADFPVLYRIDNDTVGTCVWFTDLRYVFPAMLPPFRYGMCDIKNQWRPYRLERHTINTRQPLKWPFPWT